MSARGEIDFEDAHLVSSFVCLLGFFLHIVFSQPLLAAMGLSTAAEQGGNLFAKIHPGSYAVFLAFFAYLWERGNPVQEVLSAARRFPAYAGLLGLYIALAGFWVLRDVSGVGLLFDTHMPLPICAIILSSAPKDFCRRALYGFVILAAVNSSTGIIEAIGKFRVFTFDSDWVVLREEYFRASALVRHPPINAMFTSVAMFVTLAIRLPVILKGILLGIFTVSLVAFGGRAGIGFSVIGLAVCGIDAMRRTLASGRMPMRRLFLLLTLAALLPLGFLGGLNVLLKSSIGERIAATSSLDDDSAQGRWLAFNVFDKMSETEIIMGVSGERVVNIAYRLGLMWPISDIENPWVLMLMQLGAVGFAFWLAATGIFVYHLVRGRPLPLQLAVLIYFITASTSNSFGRKDSVYLIMVCAVMCAARVLAAHPAELPSQTQAQIAFRPG